MRNPGSKLRLIIIGALAFITFEPASPPWIASKTVCGFTPAAVARTRASASPWMFAPTTIWFASLVTFPAPCAPHRTADLPTTSNKGLARSKSPAPPPTMIARSPDIAKGSPPETGASRKLTFFSASPAPSSWETPGAIEDMSTTRSPSDAPSMMPPSPRIACFA